jgi:hypothetical protein
MPFDIRMGIPEMEEFWNDLISRKDKDKLDRREEKFLKKLSKILEYLSQNPKHNSLSTHEIAVLTIRYGIKVWQSYLENNKPAAGRIFWVYGPGKNDITIIGIEPHPDDSKSKGYNKVKLSSIPKN